MDAETLRLVVASALGGALALWIFSSLVFSVSGEWVRVVDDDDRTRRERIALGTFGPFVTGRSDRAGGHHEYTGVTLFNTLYLTRRDHGMKMLEAQGYPPPVAKQRDGQVAAKLVLRLVDGTHLVGKFTPFRVEFTHQPPRVTSVLAQAPERRTYTRLGEVDEEELVPTEPLVDTETVSTRSHV